MLVGESFEIEYSKPPYDPLPSHRASAGPAPRDQLVITQRGTGGGQIFPEHLVYDLHANEKREDVNEPDFRCHNNALPNTDTRGPRGTGRPKPGERAEGRREAQSAQNALFLSFRN